MLKSDCFGMEIHHCTSKCNNDGNVKIRPFRYGNAIVDTVIVWSVVVKIRLFRYGNYSTSIQSASIANTVKIRPFRYGNNISSVISFL